jgi:hypothetical protein
MQAASMVSDGGQDAETVGDEDTETRRRVPHAPR